MCCDPRLDVVVRAQTKYRVPESPLQCLNKGRGLRRCYLFIVLCIRPCTNDHATKVDAADEAFARAGELNPRLDLTVVAQASHAVDPFDADTRQSIILSVYCFHCGCEEHV